MDANVILRDLVGGLVIQLALATAERDQLRAEAAKRESAADHKKG